MESARQTGNLNITLLWAMKYRPKNLRGDVKSRKQHSFLYVEDGIYRFSFEKESFFAEKGDLVYLPKGSQHRFEIVNKKAICYQIEFDAGDSAFCFFSTPVKLERDEKNVSLLMDTVRLFHTGMLSDYLLALGSLCQLCSVLAGQIHGSTRKKSRIRPALEYLEAHCHEKIDISILAELCHMSLSQLRRYFASELQTTPTAYKNALRIERAKRILCNEDVNVSETAQRLGFENIYVFSNTFKKYAGISPTQFIKALKNQG